jgi:hypothetical protein
MSTDCPPSPDLRIAYIILAHAQPAQLCRLIQRLDGDHARFLIHIDKKSSRNVYEQAHRALCTNPRVTFLRRCVTRRATFGQVLAPLNAWRVSGPRSEALRLRDSPQRTGLSAQAKLGDHQAAAGVFRCLLHQRLPTGGSVSEHLARERDYAISRLAFMAGEGPHPRSIQPPHSRWT